MPASRTLVRIALAASTLAIATLAQAQSSGAYNTYGNDRSAWIPSMKGGYVGGALGRSQYDVPGGNGAFGNFDDKDTMGKLYTGAMFNPNFGLELGYLHFGEIDRAGGQTRAQGLNLSAVARAPLGERFDVFGKLGTTYGWTHTSAALASGIPSGNDHGFGLSYGVGGSYYFTPQLAGTLEWESHDLKFAGTGRDQVKAVTVGLRYNY